MKLEQIMNQDNRETLDMYAQACMAVRKNDGVLYPRIAIITGDFFPMMTDALTTEQWQSESPRVLRRLRLLREWSHEQEQREQIFP